MSKILYQIVVESVYKKGEIQRVSVAGGKPVKWIFDFKAQSLKSDFLREYARCFWDLCNKQFRGSVQIGGMESGAISLVTGISLLAPEGRVVNPFYIRKSRKKSDLANVLEGALTDDPIILVDDILNEGRAIRKQIAIIEDLGKKVSALFVCIRYRDMSHYQDLLDRGIVIVSIFELNDFQSVLPVQNFVFKAVDKPRFDKYLPDYKIRLTDSPNFYLVVPKSAPLLVDELLYLGADDGTFHCIRAIDGVREWTYRVPFGTAGKYIFSSPVVYRDRVIFGAYDGNLYCLNRFTGKREWVFSDADWIGSSPCVNEADGVVYVGLEFGLPDRRGGVVAVDIRTGKVKWGNYTFRGLVHASPAYNQKSSLVVCGSNDGNMYALAAATGKIVWRFGTLDEVKYGAVFDEKRGLVVFGGIDGWLYVLQMRDGLLYHKFRAHFGFYSTPALFRNLAIAGSLDKNIYGFNLDTKQTEWVFETAGRVFASPIVEGESVFIGSNDGRLYELEARTGKVLSVVQFSERIVNRIQIASRSNGKRVLYVPTHAGELYRFRDC